MIWISPTSGATAHAHIYLPKAIASSIVLIVLSACSPSIKKSQSPAISQCDVSLIVLGVAQDGGKPQLGNRQDPAWANQELRRLATSIALVDHRDETPKRWLFEATPDIKPQLHMLNKIAPSSNDTTLQGVFLTHAHIGHYTGLMFFGHESAGVSNLVTYAMPKMADYLSDNGPWNQLVKYQNIVLAIMEPGAPEHIGRDISVMPFLVPHRQEYSEVVGYKIKGPSRTAVFLPDIDSWKEWEQSGTKIEGLIQSVDIAFLDATFYADGEIPGRDMSGFPHPFVTTSMKRFKNLAPDEKAKINFIHMNHTNPLLDPTSDAQETVAQAGYKVASEGQKVCL